MRIRRSVCLVVLVVITGLGAQPPAQGPAPGPNLLDDTLQNWEKAMTNLKTFVAKVERSTADKVWKSLDVHSGEIKFAKGQGGQGSRFTYYMRKDPAKSKPAPPPNAPEAFERIIYTGNTWYVFEPDKKVIRFFGGAGAKGGQDFDDIIVGLLKGMSAAEAKKRFQVTYVPAPPEQAKWYHFLKIVPIQDDDKRSFSEMRLTLSAGTYLPRQLWFREPNGNEITWECVDVKVNVDIPQAEFQNPTLPKGWQFVRGDQPKVRS